MKSIIAKTANGTIKEQSLYTHTLAVTEIARYVFNKLNPKFFTCDKDTILEMVTTITMMHDIGKCTAAFQKGMRDTSLATHEHYGHHNVIGSAIYKRFVRDADDTISSVIYNHHISPKTDGMVLVESVLKEKSKFGRFYDGATDDATVKRVLSDIVKICKNRYGITIELKPNKTAKLDTSYITFERIGDSDCMSETLEKNAITLFLHSLLFYADRTASSLDDTSIDDVANGCISGSVAKDIDDYINMDSTNWLGVDANVENLCKKEYTKKRLSEQARIAKLDNKTISVCVPTGNGKTLISMLWASHNKKRTKIISPEKSVTRSNFDGVSECLRDMGQSDKVSIVCGGYDPKKVNDKDDITCINIDSFLDYGFNNGEAINFLGLLVQPFVFDEWHILCEQNNAISTLFMTILYARHVMFGAKTLLLSATPISVLTDILTDADTSDPVWVEKTSSYKASNKYRLHTISDSDKSHKAVVDILNDNNRFLCRVNSHKQVKRIYDGIIDKGNVIVYSNRKTTADNDATYDEITSTFKPKCERAVARVRKNLIATTKGEKSINYSCNGMVDFNRGAIDFIQGIGRVHRRKSSVVADIYVYNYKHSRPSNSESENARIEIAKRWFGYICAYDGCVITEGDLYKLYESFTKKEICRFRNYVKSNYDEGVVALQAMRLYRKSQSYDNVERICTRATLRGTSDQIFVTADSCDPIAISVGDIRRDLGDDFDNLMKINKAYLKAYLMREYGIKTKSEFIRRFGDKFNGDYSDILTFFKTSECPFDLDNYATYDNVCGLIIG